METSEKRRRWASLTPKERAALEYHWPWWARPDQLPPAGDWQVWLLLAGRGFGKSRTGAEWIRAQAESGRCRRMALVARTSADVRDVMVEGESGLLAISPPWFRPRWEPSKRRLTWPNGATATTFSADEPDALRGPQYDGAWADEIAAWAYPEAWDQLLFGLRLGSRPRVLATTTPRPTPLIRSLMIASTTHVTRGSTYANRDNLAPTFFTQVLAKYEGTRLGRQEIYGEVVDDREGALWTRDALRYGALDDVQRDTTRIVVAVDPAVSAGDDSNETGIVVVGKGVDGSAYVLDDLSCKLSPDAWARRVVQAYRHYQADRVVAEINQGGDLVERVLRTVDKNISYKGVRATKGKAVRAEPVAALYEQRRVLHARCFPALEDQMCSYVPGDVDGSPDRVDALVWGLTELMFSGAPAVLLPDTGFTPRRM